MSKRSLVGRFFAAIWGGVDSVRKILHLVLLLFIFMLVFGAMQDTPLVLPERAALVVEPYGYLVEQIEGHPLDRALAELAGDGRPQTLVQDIVDALDYAKDDDRIEVVYLELSSLLGGGLAKLQRVAAAIEEFRGSGKPVIASADFLSQQGYYLAAHADEIYLHPHGLVLMQGYGRWRTFYKDAIDLLRVDWNVFRVGTHKSFVEPDHTASVTRVSPVTGRLWRLLVVRQAPQSGNSTMEYPRPRPAVPADRHSCDCHCRPEA